MFYSYKNIKIHYQVIGSGKPIFMIHGLDCDLNLMKGCFEPIFKNKNGYKSHENKNILITKIVHRCALI